MANIHRLSDYENRPEPQASPSSPIGFINVHNVIYGNFGIFSDYPQISPKEFHFCHLFTRYWKFLSASFAILFLQCILYSVSVGLTAASRPYSDPFYIDIVVLKLLGAHSYDGMLRGEVYRLFTALFLHGDRLHILFNTTFQLVTMFAVEYHYKVVKFVIAYVLTGMTANLFSDAITKGAVKMGASSSLFGIIGMFVGEAIFYWKHIQRRYHAVSGLVMTCLLSFLLYLFISNVDIWAHVGGFLSGILIVFPLNYKNHLKPQWYMTGCIISVGLLLGIITACCLIIYL